MSLLSNLVEEAVEVDVDGVTRGGIKEYVLTMPVTKTQDVSHHGHDSCGTAVCQACTHPTCTRDIISKNITLRWCGYLQ